MTCTRIYIYIFNYDKKNEKYCTYLLYCIVNIILNSTQLNRRLRTQVSDTSMSASLIT